MWKSAGCGVRGGVATAGDRASRQSVRYWNVIGSTSLDGATVKRTVETASPNFLYVVADQTADFGAPPASLRIRVAQFNDFGATGLNKELTITL